MSDVTKIKEAINGKKYRCWIKADGYYTDPFVLQQFWSRTFMPKGTDHEEADTIEDMKLKIKDKDIKFKEKDLSEESIAIFDADPDLKDKKEKDKELKDEKELG